MYNTAATDTVTKNINSFIKQLYKTRPIGSTYAINNRKGYKQLIFFSISINSIQRTNFQSKNDINSERYEWQVNLLQCHMRKSDSLLHCYGSYIDPMTHTVPKTWFFPQLHRSYNLTVLKTWLSTIWLLIQLVLKTWLFIYNSIFPTTWKLLQLD